MVRNHYISNSLRAFRVSSGTSHRQHILNRGAVSAFFAGDSRSPSSQSKSWRAERARASERASPPIHVDSRGQNIL